MRYWVEWLCLYALISTLLSELERQTSPAYSVFTTNLKGLIRIFEKYFLKEPPFLEWFWRPFLQKHLYLFRIYKTDYFGVKLFEKLYSYFLFGVMQFVLFLFVLPSCLLNETGFNVFTKLHSSVFILFIFELKLWEHKGQRLNYLEHYALTLKA